MNALYQAAEAEWARMRAEAERRRTRRPQLVQRYLDEIHHLLLHAIISQMSHMTVDSRIKTDVVFDAFVDDDGKPIDDVTLLEEVERRLHATYGGALTVCSGSGRMMLYIPNVRTQPNQPNFVTTPGLLYDDNNIP